MDDQTVFVNERIEAVKRGSYVELHYKHPHLIRIDTADRQAVDDEVIRMLRMRTRGGGKYLTQEEVGKIICDPSLGVTRVRHF